MNDTATVTSDSRDRLRRRLAADPDGVIEALAGEHGVTPLEATRMLPAANCRWAPGDAFAAVMDAVAWWGEVTFIVHTRDIVLECQGPVPRGTFGRGYFNLHGDSPIGGHIKADRCVAIAFVRRPFMGRESCSIQFFGPEGEAMFKIFVRRQADRSLNVAQVRLFENIAAVFGSAEGAAAQTT